MIEFGEGFLHERAHAQPDKCEYWRRDHAVDYNGADTKFVLKSQIPGGAQAAFRLGAQLGSGRIRIVSSFRWGAIAADITDAEKQSTIQQFKNRVSAWGGHYRMKIVDPECGTKVLPIEFLLLWAGVDTTSSASHRVNLFRTYPRAGVTAATVTYNKADATTEVVTLEPPGANIMKTFGSVVYQPRFFYFAAIEAQELPRRVSGRAVTCEIVS